MKTGPVDPSAPAADQFFDDFELWAMDTTSAMIPTTNPVKKNELQCILFCLSSTPTAARGKSCRNKKIFSPGKWKFLPLRPYILMRFGRPGRPAAIIAAPGRRNRGWRWTSRRIISEFDLIHLNFSQKQP
jgi:hypothetical protein